MKDLVSSKNFTAVTHTGMNLLAIPVYLLLCYICKNIYPSSKLGIDIIFLCACLSAIPQLTYETFQASRLKDTQKICDIFSPKQNFCLYRILHKLLGLFGIFSIIYLIYALFPMFDHREFSFFIIAMSKHMPLLSVISIIYVLITDRYDDDPKDGLYLTGRLFLGKYDPQNQDLLHNYWLGWLVKLFFLPLMVYFLTSTTNALMEIDFTNAYLDITYVKSMNFWYRIAYRSILLIDLLFVVSGYSLALKLFNTQIRSSDPSLMGWSVCILCYFPFFGQFFSPNFFAYNDGIYWGDYFATSPILFLIWGSILVFLYILWVSATATAGCRFSNLTYRGLFCNGLYRFTKHPSYVIKNIAWWMVSMPILTASDWSMALQNSSLLLCVNIIYFARARTEERHLSQYPEYRAYAEYMNEKSIFSALGKLYPYFKYQAP